MSKQEQSRPVHGPHGRGPRMGGKKVPMDKVTAKRLIKYFKPYSGRIAHFKNVDFSTTWPADLTVVVTHQPECRPKTVSCLRQLYECLDLSVSEEFLMHGIDPSGCK